MDLTEVMYYRTIVELGTISKASAYLRIAQPALSRQIQKLEHRLGVDLLQRSVKGVTPTAAGKLLLERTANLETTLADIYRDVSTYSAEVSGSLCVGVQPSLSTTMMPNLLRDFMLEHPKVALRVIAGYSADMIDAMLEETIDVAVVDTPSHAPRELTVMPLWMETLQFIGMASSGPTGLFERGPVPLSEIVKLPLILPSPRYSIRRLIDQTVAREHLKLSPIAEIDGATMIFAMVKNGLGFTVMPTIGAAATLRRNKVSAAETAPAIDRPLSIVARTAVLRDRKATTFIRLFKTAATDLMETEHAGALRLTLGEEIEVAREKSTSTRALRVVSSTKA